MKHLNFEEELSKSGKTKIITISSAYDKTELGKISWYSHWRQYVFVPNIRVETIWTYDCLEELKDFVIKLNNEQKRGGAL